jgi:hypothetical protein
MQRALVVAGIVVIFAAAVRLAVAILAPAVPALMGVGIVLALVTAGWPPPRDRRKRRL